MTEDQASSLASLGRELASRKAWWGANATATPKEKSVIRVQRASTDRWRVRIADCIGIVEVPGVHLVCRPKIPSSHLLPLLALGGAIPRLSKSITEYADG